MSHCRKLEEIPFILVGTQDSIGKESPRVIDDARARNLASDIKRCSYYETCATHGLNVDRVFEDACQKIVQQRLTESAKCITPTNSRPSTPCGNRGPIVIPRSAHRNTVISRAVNSSPTGISSLPHSPSHQPNNSHSNRESMNFQPQVRHHTLPTHHIQDKYPQLILQENNNILKYLDKLTRDSLAPPPVAQPTRGAEPQATPLKTDPLPTPNATPNTTRKTRRRSNLFTPRKGQNEDKIKNGELGSGRAIPFKQGYLYKRSGKALNKDWKKKYVTLCDDGRLTYHPSLHDYMDDSHAKEISLQYVTVRVPGQKPRGSKSIKTAIGNNGSASINEGLGGLSLTGYNCKDNKRVPERVLLSAMDVQKEPSVESKIETPNVKKRHRRMKSSVIKNGDYDDAVDGYEFYIVSLDNKQWHFEAGSCEERDEWVTAIEQQILTSLQSNESCKKSGSSNNATEQASIQSIRARVSGNTTCVDCDAPNPDWASLNLGILMCIECSGIHRNLGSHITRVRSLDLDEWPPGHLSVMLTIGNQLANSIWESNPKPHFPKPIPSSSREEKERYIRAKYETKEFLHPMANHVTVGGATPSCPAPGGGVPLNHSPEGGVTVRSSTQQLVDAVCKSDIRQIITILAHSGADVVNGTVSRTDLRTPLHLTCSMGNLAIAQLLIWNNANILALDHEKRTCLDYARAAAVKNLVENVENTSQTENMEDAKGLADLLVLHGCPETTNGAIDQLPSSIERVV